MNPIDLSPLLQGQPEIVQRIVIELFPFLLALIVILLLRWLLTLSWFDHCAPWSAAPKAT